MTTLEAIGFNLMAGCSMGAVVMVAFGWAVSNRHEFVAPRCTARPKRVIYPGPIHQGGGRHLNKNGIPTTTASNTTNNNKANPSSSSWPSQWNPVLDWIPWTLSLTYDTLLRGVPWTGTRQGGQSGALLKVNLDAIVLLRFHAVCLKLSALASILFILVLLPMYISGGCHHYKNNTNEGQNQPPSLVSNYNNTTTTSQQPPQSSIDDDDFENAFQLAPCSYNLTNYERTTIANVPGSFDGNHNSNRYDASDTSRDPNQESVVRLYFCVFCFWIVQGYLLHLLQREWIEILALRRVYYLEANVWGDRQEELHEIQVLHDQNPTQQQQQQQKNKKKKQKKKMDELKSKQKRPVVRTTQVLGGGTMPPPNNNNSTSTTSRTGLRQRKRSEQQQQSQHNPNAAEREQHDHDGDDDNDDGDNNNDDDDDYWEQQSNTTTPAAVRNYYDPHHHHHHDNDDDDDHHHDNNEKNNETDEYFYDEEEAQEDYRRLHVRDPWIPHPEHRNTVPNIQLYSVMVGGLPSLPPAAAAVNGSGGIGDDLEAAAPPISAVAAAAAAAAATGQQPSSSLVMESNHSQYPIPPALLSSAASIPLPPTATNPTATAGAHVPNQQHRTVDWHLALTAAFFDHCVPNQPGFSSSVAAVTVLPSSKAIASAWRKWYKAASKHRRLRFLRRVMDLKYQQQQQRQFQLQQQLEQQQQQREQQQQQQPTTKSSYIPPPPPFLPPPPPPPDVPPPPPPPPPSSPTSLPPPSLDGLPPPPPPPPEEEEEKEQEECPPLHQTNIVIDDGSSNSNSDKDNAQSDIVVNDGDEEEDPPPPPPPQASTPPIKQDDNDHDQKEEEEKVNEENRLADDKNDDDDNQETRDAKSDPTWSLHNLGHEQQANEEEEEGNDQNSDGELSGLSSSRWKKMRRRGNKLLNKTASLVQQHRQKRRSRHGTDDDHRHEEESENDDDEEEKGFGSVRQDTLGKLRSLPPPPITTTRPFLSGGDPDSSGSTNTSASQRRSRRSETSQATLHDSNNDDASYLPHTYPPPDAPTTTTSATLTTGGGAGRPSLYDASRGCYSDGHLASSAMHFNYEEDVVVPEPIMSSSVAGQYHTNADGTATVRTPHSLTRDSTGVPYNNTSDYGDNDAVDGEDEDDEDRHHHKSGGGHVFGPEQYAIYSREYAQAAAPCCPNGCCEQAVLNHCTLEELQLLEFEAMMEVRKANEELFIEQQKAKEIHHFYPSSALTTASMTTPPSNSQQQQHHHHQQCSYAEGTRPTDSSEAMDLEAQEQQQHQQSQGTILSASGNSSSHGVTYDPLVEGGASGQSTSTLRERRKKKQRKNNKKSNSATELELEERLYRTTDLYKKDKSGNVGSRRRGRNDSDDDDDGKDDSCSNADALNSTMRSSVRSVTRSHWDKVTYIVASMQQELNRGGVTSSRKLQRGRSLKKWPAITGAWDWPKWADILGETKDTTGNTTLTAVNMLEDFIDLSRESTYAVVTFTSRQAAVAARQCLTDGRATGRWRAGHELPIPPLADAAACDVFMFRNCCRPVTMSIDERQKTQRHYVVLALLGAFYVMSPFCLSLFASVLNPETLEEAMPMLFQWLEVRFGNGISETVAGFLQSSLYTLFFALCPVFFKALANFGSSATSVANAELKALQYFWWFMLVSAFWGTLVANMFLLGFKGGIGGGKLSYILLEMARAIPSTTAATWLNWINLRTTFVITAQYLLQLPTFLYSFVGLRCCARLTRGGGAGPPTPYRLYVDSGTVLLSLLALGPASPLVAPASFFYFLWTQPVLRRCVIFVYRPRFDGGGLRWPFVYDMTISALLVGHILLTLQMFLKQATGPAVLASLPMLVTLLSYRNNKKQFLGAFNDAALLQTSLLDGWDATEETNMEKREEFRRFLVDAHKAAYVPVCLAGPEKASLTAEPAVVVPLETDYNQDTEVIAHDEADEDDVEGDEEMTPLSPDRPSFDTDSNNNNGNMSEQQVLENTKNQYGAMLRRAAKTIQVLQTKVKEANSTGSHIPSSAGASVASADSAAAVEEGSKTAPRHMVSLTEEP